MHPVRLQFYNVVYIFYVTLWLVNYQLVRQQPRFTVWRECLLYQYYIHRTWIFFFVGFIILFIQYYSVICRPSDQWPQCGEAPGRDSSPGRAAQTTTPPCKIYFEQILKIQLWHSANLPEIFLSCFSKWARCPPQSPPLPSEKLYKKTC